MGFFSFLVLLIIAYLVWRISDQLPDLLFRVSELQRDVAELRRLQSTNQTDAGAAAVPAPEAAAGVSATTGEDAAGSPDTGAPTGSTSGGSAATTG